MNGRIISKYSLKEGENRIDTSLLSSGIYIFNYNHKTKTKNQIVIKE